MNATTIPAGTSTTVDLDHYFDKVLASSSFYKGVKLTPNWLDTQGSCTSATVEYGGVNCTIELGGRTFKLNYYEKNSEDKAVRKSIDTRCATFMAAVQFAVLKLHDVSTGGKF